MLPALEVLPTREDHLPVMPVSDIRVGRPRLLAAVLLPATRADTVVVWEAAFPVGRSRLEVLPLQARVTLAGPHLECT